MGRIELVLFNKIPFIIGINLVILIILLETTLRCLPSKYTEFPDRIDYNSDKVIGYYPTPFQDENYFTSCVKNSHIRTNEMGMRIIPTKPNQSLKIALIGDSFLHGLTVSDSLHLATKLSLYTNNEVMNGGVSGYGTYQELLLWRKFMKPQKPYITVLFLFLENDIRDNQCELARQEAQIYSPCCIVNNDSILQVNDFEIRKNNTEGFAGWFKKNCYTYRAIRKLLKTERLNITGEEFFKQTSFAYNIYRPNFDKLWEDGWGITEWSLALLKKECDEVGSKLLVVNVSGPIQWSYNWKLEISKQIQDDYLPADFDVDYANKRLQSIFNRTGIEILDLKPGFINYRDKHRLQQPIFGWCCDTHWNPLGHQLTADLVYNHLVQLGWHKGIVLEDTKPPKEVLGEKLFEQIYSCQEIVF